MPPKKIPKVKNGNSATLDFESQLWADADKLRGRMDALLLSVLDGAFKGEL